MTNTIGGDSANLRFSTETISEWGLNALEYVFVCLFEIAQTVAVSIGGIFISIGEFSLVSMSIGDYAIYKFRNKRKVFYRFHVKENIRPIHTEQKAKDDHRLVDGPDFYAINPVFTITNVSKFEWKIQKICVARLPWVKFFRFRMSMLECKKGYRIKKRKILQELLFDNEGFTQNSVAHHPASLKGALRGRDSHLPIKPGKSRTIYMVNYPGTVFLYSQTLLDAAGKPSWLKANIDSRRYYWVAMINDRECLIGDRVECIGKEMRSRRKS